MKAKVSFYAEMPNVAKFRSRVSNPSKDLTSQLRGILTQAIVETVNENILGIRAKFIAAISALDINYTSKANQDSVNNVLNSIFDVVASIENNKPVEFNEGVDEEVSDPLSEEAPKAAPADWD